MYRFIRLFPWRGLHTPDSLYKFSVETVKNYCFADLISSSSHFRPTLEEQSDFIFSSASICNFKHSSSAQIVADQYIAAATF